MRPDLAARYGPHKLLLLVVSVLVGAAYLLGAPAPGSVTALLPRWEIHAWAGAMLASGVAGLAGCAWRNAVTGLRIEAGAMLIGAGTLWMYVAAVFAAGGWRALLAGGITVAWGVANLIRAGQIRHMLRGV